MIVIRKQVLKTPTYFGAEAPPSIQRSTSARLLATCITVTRFSGNPQEGPRPLYACTALNVNRKWTLARYFYYYLNLNVKTAVILYLPFHIL